MMIFNLNGELFKENEAKISVLDRGFLYGDGIYETVLVCNGRPFLLGKHLERLRSSAKIIRVDLPWTNRRFEEEITRLLQASGESDAALRINVSRGVGSWQLSTKGAQEPTILFSLFPIPDYPTNTYTRGWEVIISREYVTMDPVIPAVAKTTNRLSLVLAKREAEEKGGKEAILLNMQGFLTEGAASNVFFVKDGNVFTPSLESGILEGVTRGVAIDIVRKKGIDVKEALFRPDDLLDSDEAFLTFTTAGIVPVYSIDGSVVGSGSAGPVTQMVIESYTDEVDRGTNSSGRMETDD
jgi:branched-chain amino acid aminotransferase